LLVHPDDRHLQHRVVERALGGWTGLGGVVGGRGELQYIADRLDPEPGPVLLDEGDYFVRRRSSSAPKKVAAAWRISLARLSSLISRSSSVIWACSAEVTPGRDPAATSAYLTQKRKDTTPTPSLRATQLITPLSPGSSRRS